MYNWLLFLAFHSFHLFSSWSHFTLIYSSNHVQMDNYKVQDIYAWYLSWNSHRCLLLYSDISANSVHPASFTPYSNPLQFSLTWPFRYFMQNLREGIISYSFSLPLVSNQLSSLNLPPNIFMKCLKIFL